MSFTHPRRLRIAQIAPPHVPIPPVGYGASELVAGNLTEELVRRGHEVVLFAHPDSTSRAEVVSFPEASVATEFDHRELIHVARTMQRASEFDIIHNHCLSAGPALAGLCPTPSLSTLHYLYPIGFGFPEHAYVAISWAQRALVTELNVVGTVYNGVDCSLFPVVEPTSDYLLYMGRIDQRKGPDVAIQVARMLGMRLILAGPAYAWDMEDYFTNCIKPHLHGNIEYIGEARGQQKIDLLAHARCVLVPSRRPEPFGLVAVEAMACGTPVIAYRSGALPEIVADGEVGFVVETPEAMAAAVERTDTICPARCREVAETTFSVSRMADGYLAVYQTLARDLAPSCA